MFRLLVGSLSSIHRTVDARGTHDVALTSSGAALLGCCPELRRKATEREDGTWILPYSLVLRLALPLVGPKRRDDAPHEWQANLWTRAFDPGELGRSVAAAFGSAHFDAGRQYKSLAALGSALRLARDKMVAAGEDSGAFALDFESMLTTGIRAEGESHEEADERLASADDLDGHCRPQPHGLLPHEGVGARLRGPQHSRLAHRRRRQLGR